AETDSACVIDHYVVGKECERRRRGRDNWFWILPVPFEDLLIGPLCRYKRDRALVIDCRKLRKVRNALSAIGYIHKFDLSVVWELSKGLPGTKSEQHYGQSARGPQLLLYVQH